MVAIIEDNGPERRNGIRRASDLMANRCIQKIPINDIKNEIKSINSCIKSLETIIGTTMAEMAGRQKDIFNILFGKDLESGLITLMQLQKASIVRLWWLIGLVLPGAVGLATGILLYFFKKP